jgi:hypothetical protein
MGMMPFHSECTDLCAEPGGPLLCLYVCLCPWCAAGDVAEASGRSYICSCLIAPLLSHALSVLTDGNGGNCVRTEQCNAVQCSAV